MTGFLGCFISLVGFYSLHKEVLWNYNAMLFNPLFIILPFLKRQWFKKVTIVCIVMTAIYLIIMITKPHLLLMLPFIGTTFYILYMLLKKAK